MKLNRTERLLGIILILVVAGFFGYGLGYINEGMPFGGHVPVNASTVTPFERAYGEIYAVRKHAAGLEGSMIGMGLVVVILGAVFGVWCVRARVGRNRNTNGPAA